MAEYPSSPVKFRIKADLLLGAAIMGTTGAIIGYYVGGGPPIVLGTVLGCLLGGLVSMHGARSFFLSVLAGTLLGGIVAREFGGADMVMIGAGSGAAIGGFVGVNIEMFRRGSSRPGNFDKKI